MTALARVISEEKRARGGEVQSVNHSSIGDGSATYDFKCELTSHIIEVEYSNEKLKSLEIQLYYGRSIAYESF